ncbi:MAG: hypothetical protein JXB47_20305 [Anaerolineae bacterium]|nr:hypothetical protein [Anaerolineae bacterium]
MHNKIAIRFIFIFVLTCCLLTACSGGATSTPVQLMPFEAAAIFLRYASAGDTENASAYYCEYMRATKEGDTFVHAFSNMGAADIRCTPGPYADSVRCTYTQTRDITGKTANEAREVILRMVGGQFCGLLGEPAMPSPAAP